MSVDLKNIVDLTHLFQMPVRPTDLLITFPGIVSRSEAKRLISQGAVKYFYPDLHLSITITSDEPIRFRNEDIIHIGKRRWYLLKLPRIVAEVHEFTSPEAERAFLEASPHISKEAIEHTMKEDWG